MTSKEKTVAVIFDSGYLTKTSFEDKIKLERRLRRAIKYMVEDGFTHIILPLVDLNPFFPSAFNNVMAIEKRLNPNIFITAMLLYEMDSRYFLSPDETFRHQTIFADSVVYYQEAFIYGEEPNYIETLLENSAAVITYYESDCPQLTYVTRHATQSRMPLVNIVED